ncbi:MAG: caspase family protein [Anaerolineae bacterium]|nr:caspase family protein [Anaerolineae bacterium]
MEAFANGYALLIGVDEHLVPAWALPTVARDIDALAGVLAHPERCAYPSDQVKQITGEAATRDGILAGLDWLGAQLKQSAHTNTTAIIYFSGHGWVDENDNYYLIPYDVPRDRKKTRSLPADDFAAEIAAIGARRLLVVLDCCFAGGMGVKTLAQGSALPPTLFVPGGEPGIGKGLDKLKRGRGRAVLSSSTRFQPSYVRPDKTMSIFTYHLIEALTGHARYQTGATEVLVSDVMSYVEHRVPATARATYNANQQPAYHVTGNFPVALLLGGKGLAEGETPPSPLSTIPATMSSHVQGDHNVVVQGDGNVTAIGGSVAAGGNVGDVTICGKNQ